MAGSGRMSSQHLLGQASGSENGLSPLADPRFRGFGVGARECLSPRDASALASPSCSDAEAGEVMTMPGATLNVAVRTERLSEGDMPPLPSPEPTGGGGTGSSAPRSSSAAQTGSLSRRKQAIARLATSPPDSSPGSQREVENDSLGLTERAIITGLR